MISSLYSNSLYAFQSGAFGNYEYVEYFGAGMYLIRRIEGPTALISKIADQVPNRQSEDSKLPHGSDSKNYNCDVWCSFHRKKQKKKKTQKAIVHRCIHSRALSGIGDSRYPELVVLETSMSYVA
jgi:hypothetical protein